MRYKLYIFIFVLLSIDFFLASHAPPQTNENSLSASASKKLTLVHAAMCEDIKDSSPHNQAIVFSLEIGKVFCFTSFDPVPKKMYIYQKWFHRDKLSTKKRLLLNPPRWSTFSSIQLREADRGPWRVEIIDHEGDILRVLRFNITD